jgi:hypothetical protein
MAPYICCLTCIRLTLKVWDGSGKLRRDMGRIWAGILLYIDLSPPSTAHPSSPQAIILLPYWAELARQRSLTSAIELSYNLALFHLRSFPDAVLSLLDTLRLISPFLYLSTHTSSNFSSIEPFTFHNIHDAGQIGMH